MNELLGVAAARVHHGSTGLSGALYRDKEGSYLVASAPTGNRTGKLPSRENSSRNA